MKSFRIDPLRKWKAKIMDNTLLHDQRILLGVTGSIAVYKAADLASKLTQAGAQVDVMLTEAAERFIQPLTFQSVTGRRVFTERDLWGSDAHVLHIGLVEGKDLLVIAPATANTIAKMAQGQADTLVSLTTLTAHCPMLVAPAMDAGMFEHPATQMNLATLRKRGVMIAGPEEGRMASGMIGRGRMVEPMALVGYVRLALGRHGPLAGRTFVVTAGGTQEPLDPARTITNRSSGKQGFALAQAALDRGATVTLISGPSSLETPIGARRIDVRTAAEMERAVLEESAEADVLLMAAAVSDFRPSSAETEKIKRRKGIPHLVLEPTPDILAAVAEQRSKLDRPLVTVGFAAESKDLVPNARRKLHEKELTMVVANDITSPVAGFEVDTNQVTLIDINGGVQELPLMTKREVAEMLIQRVIQLLEESSTTLA